MNWSLQYLPEAEKDLRDLDGSQRILVLKALKKVQKNPLPVDEQGYGKPLGNHNSTSLAGLLKIKLRSSGLRIVYQLRRTESSMLVIVIGVRADEEVYDIAQKRSSYNKIVVFIDRSPAECYNSFRVLWIGEALLPQRRFLGGSNHSFFVEMLIS